MTMANAVPSKQIKAAYDAVNANAKLVVKKTGNSISKAWDFVKSFPKEHPLATSMMIQGGFIVLSAMLRSKADMKFISELDKRNIKFQPVNKV